MALRDEGATGTSREVNGGGIHDGAGVDLDAASLQLLANARKQRFTQLIVIEQVAEPEHRGGVGHGLTTQVNAYEAAQAGTVVQGLLTCQVGEVEPVLDEVNTQHALQTNGAAPITGLGIVRGNLLAQRWPRHQRIHGLEEFVTPRGFAV